MANQTRQYKVGDLLQKVISEIIHREVKDPRVKMATITDVNVSRDLSFAKVYISVLGSSEDGEKVIEGLARAKGFIRHQIGKKADLRVIPELSFVLDRSAEKGQALASLIEQARQRDNEKSSNA